MDATKTNAIMAANVFFVLGLLKLSTSSPPFIIIVKHHIIFMKISSQERNLNIMRIPVFFGWVLIFVAVVSYKRRKADRSSKKTERDFWERENNANEIGRAHV